MGHTSIVSPTEAFPGNGEATWMMISTPEEISCQNKRNTLALFTIQCTSEVVFSEIINLDKLEGGMTDASEGSNSLASGSAVPGMSLQYTPVTLTHELDIRAEVVVRQHDRQSNQLHQ